MQCFDVQSWRSISSLLRYRTPGWQIPSCGTTWQHLGAQQKTERGVCVCVCSHVVVFPHFVLFCLHLYLTIFNSPCAKRFYEIILRGRYPVSSWPKTGERVDQSSSAWPFGLVFYFNCVYEYFFRLRLMSTNSGYVLDHFFFIEQDLVRRTISISSGANPVAM